jgi:hypothetical protein
MIADVFPMAYFVIQKFSDSVLLGMVERRMRDLVSNMQEFPKRKGKKKGKLL